MTPTTGTPRRPGDRPASPVVTMEAQGSHTSADARSRDGPACDRNPTRATTPPPGHPVKRPNGHAAPGATIPAGLSRRERNDATRLDTGRPRCRPDSSRVRSRGTKADRDANVGAVAGSRDSDKQVREPRPHHKVQQREPDTTVQRRLRVCSTDSQTNTDARADTHVGRDHGERPRDPPELAPVRGSRRKIPDSGHREHKGRRT